MSAELYENMSQAEIIAEMKSLMKVLEKKEKAQTKVVEKMEVKKVAAAPAKGVRPAQLDKNAKWVKYVHTHILDNGWEEFIHAERCGKGMADVTYPASVLVDDAYVFEGSESEQPNLSHAMTLSKIYKVEKPELYAEFEAEYEPVVASSSEKAKPVRVSLTLEEKLQEKLEKAMEKEREKEEKKAERERVRAEKKAEKEEEKRLEKLAKEMAKAAKVPKGAVKAVMPKIVKVAVPKAKVVPRPVLAVPAWTPPAKGEMKRVVVAGIAYYVDHLNRMFSPNEEDMPGDCVGVYVPATHTISKEIPDDE